MKKQRQLKASIALIQGVLDRDGWEPKQRNALERAVKNLRLYRRLPSKEQAKAQALLRQLLEELVKTFIDRKSNV
jgi:hypothetical protein